MAGKSGKHKSDLRLQSAESWAKQHKQKISEAYRDDRFQKKFNQYIDKPSFKTRRDLGLKPKAAKHERMELQLIRTLKRFGDTP